jgi:Flp pilus assembly protein TadG
MARMPIDFWFKGKNYLEGSLLRPKNPRNPDGEAGGAIVEFALVVPMMVALILGMVWFGLALNNYIVLTDAVGTGARALALSRGQTSPTLAETDPCAYAVQVADADAMTLTSSKITYSITWTPLTGTGGSYTTSCPGLSMSSQDTVQVQATYPAALYLWGMHGNLTLNARTAQLVQ